MAEIKIEKKKPVWPWVLVALVVIGILIYFLTNNNQDDVRQDRQVTPTSQLVDEKDSVLLALIE